jgi:hypothetical protein
MTMKSRVAIYETLKEIAPEEAVSEFLSQFPVRDSLPHDVKAQLNAEILELRREIADLRAENARLRGTSSGSTDD